jgi:hypothetical protein
VSATAEPTKPAISAAARNKRRDVFMNPPWTFFVSFSDGS